jgi:hypothetical protein
MIVMRSILKFTSRFVCTNNATKIKKKENVLELDTSNKEKMSYADEYMKFAINLWPCETKYVHFEMRVRCSALLFANKNNFAIEKYKQP